MLLYCALRTCQKTLRPLPLGSVAGSAGHPFYSYGYATVTNVQGIGARGKIVDIVDQGHFVQLTSQEIDHGVSGGPVLDETRHVIIGMVTKGKGLPGKDQNLRNTQTTFATSADVLRSVCPQLSLATPKRKRHHKNHGDRTIAVNGDVRQSVLLTGDNNVVNVNFPPDKTAEDILASRAYPHSIGLIRPNINNYLHRSQLTDRMSSILSQTSLLIHADAGFGKTWLIKDFIDANSSSHSVTWYSFPKYGSGTQNFIIDLATDLFTQTNRQVGAKTIQFAREREFDTEKAWSPTDTLATLLREIAAHPSRSLILILEDLHNIVDEATYATIISLVQSCPKNLRSTSNLTHLSTVWSSQINCARSLIYS